MSTIDLEGNSLAPDIYLELFIFDASYILDQNGVPGIISYFSNTPVGDGVNPIQWRNNSYFPLPFELSGVDSRGDGTALARPQITLSTVENRAGHKFLLAAVLSLGDLIGMRVTRYRTFYKFTDDQPEANPNMHYPVDEWIITKKLSQSRIAVAFEMSSPLDRPGLKLPRAQILRDNSIGNTPRFPGVSKVRLR